MKKEWFTEWFDSAYYHILYQQHNENEAQAFMDTLMNKLQPQPGDTILDLACGKGRHSRYLAGKKLNVTGIDLSESSIQYARQFENENLSYYSHDMRKPFRINYFDYILNLFTSFGYFKTDAEHLETLKNIHDGLRNDGIFVLDFFNSHYIAANLRVNEEKLVGSTNFIIEKRIDNGYVFKKISFETPQQHFFFEEQVRLFTLEELTILILKAGMEVKECFGNYQLQSFDINASPRLILICSKTKK